MLLKIRTLGINRFFANVLAFMCVNKSMIARTLLYNIEFQMTTILTGSFFFMSGMYVIRA